MRIAVLLAVLLLGPAQSLLALGAPADLAARLDPILADPRLSDVQVGVVVRDAASGAVLYDHNGGARLVPGSNEKLPVIAAAFAALGPDYRFRTSLLTTARQREGTLEGHLYLKGTGDPTMTPARWAELAQALADLGITRVRGRLVVDDSWFDSVRLGPDWTWDDETFAYAAQVSALNVAPDRELEVGSVLVDVRPGSRAGTAALIEVRPPTGYVRVVSEVATGEAGSEGRLFLRREHGSNRIVLGGVLPVDAPPVRRAISVWEPTGYAADVFRLALAARGIDVDQPTLFGPAPPSAREVAVLESPPLSEIVVPFLKLSNNGIAEILVKTLGRRLYGDGSWPSGMRAVADYLTSIGIDASRLRLRDGSGLSRLNLLTARDLSALLSAIRAAPWFPYLYQALPIAGIPDRLAGGTLRLRMRGTRAEGNVRAKTGTLTGVTALSGYVTDEADRLLVFSILINNFTGPIPRGVEDAVAVALAGGVSSASGLNPAFTGVGERREDLLQLRAQRLEPGRQ